MLEMVLAIKNNNMSKIPNYNPEVVERLRKSLKMLIRKGNFTSELKISLKDLLNGKYQILRILNNAADACLLRKY